MFAVLSAPSWASHPSLVLTPDSVRQIRAELGTLPLFDATLARAKAEIDAEIAAGIDTPLPRDFSGGYTHERHKRNALLMPKAGALYQILEDEKYAIYLRDMLLQYESMYRDLPLHPQERSYARGKLFWQCLNDANWLLYASLGYDAIYAWLSDDERKRLEGNLFRPFADFLSVENPQFFNRIHNHSTWGTAAVGMIGLVMDDDELVTRALHGLANDGLDFAARDNDGGFIRRQGDAAGFLANLDEPFSPDGYYTEGPYYQRYAMTPFLVFGLALHNAKPELGIIEFKDGVLIKAVNTLLNLADANGAFFPLNDAQKGMSVLTPSVVTAVDIGYYLGPRDPGLLDIAARQGRVTLDAAGFSVAKGVRDGKSRPFAARTVNLADGPNGQQGGVAVLRSADPGLSAVFKYSAQGLSHGHYDKLSLSLYNRGNEVLQDYGMVRFVNIGQKGGGNYLPENTTWAKQTIAHNTVVQDGESHFGGRYETGSQHHSELLFFAAAEGVQVVSAVERNAYPGTTMQRTVAIIESPGDVPPLVLDVFRLASGAQHRYDLPFWFVGQYLGSSARFDASPTLSALGSANGYQHIYHTATGSPAAGSAQLQWLTEGEFFTLTTAAEAGDEWLLGRVGASDPDFNLRPDPGLIVRRKNTANTVFASVVERHGAYSAVTELTTEPYGRIASVTVIHDDERYTAVELADREGRQSVFVVANGDHAANAKHTLKTANRKLHWQGPYYYLNLD